MSTIASCDQAEKGYHLERIKLAREKTDIDLLEAIESYLRTSTYHIDYLRSIDPKKTEQFEQKLSCLKAKIAEKNRQFEECSESVYQWLAKKIAETEKALQTMEATLAGPFQGYAPYFEWSSLGDQLQTFKEQFAAKNLAELSSLPLEVQRLKEELRSLYKEEMALAETGDAKLLSGFLNKKEELLAQREDLQAKVGRASIPVLRAQLKEKQEAAKRRFEEIKQSGSQK